MTKQAAKADKKNVLIVDKPPEKHKEQVHADLAVNPALMGAVLVQQFGKSHIGPLEIGETLEAVMETTRKVKKGDMSGPEAMLVSQASALNSMFTELARRAGVNMGDYIEAMDRYLRLALKAQAQCRTTIETLAEMKNPRLVIARQANISNGPQQVNNGTAPPRAEVSSNEPNELLEHRNEPRLESGAAGTPGKGDPAVVPVEASHRT
jgi:hypothetical protein